MGRSAVTKYFLVIPILWSRSIHKAISSDTVAPREALARISRLSTLYEGIQVEEFVLDTKFCKLDTLGNILHRFFNFSLIFHSLTS